VPQLNRVFIAGSFTNLQNTTGTNTAVVRQAGLASYNYRTGLIDTSFRPTFNGGVAAVEASPDGTKLFVAGSFNTVNGVAEQKVASLNLTTGAPLSSFVFNKNTNNQVQSLAASNSTIYVGGRFTRVNGVLKTGLAAANAASGAVDTAFTAYAVAFPDGPHNIEALFVDPRDGTAYGIVKLAAARTSVWALPRVAGAVATAVHVGELTIPSADPRVTAADMAVDACAARVLVRSHDALYELRGAAAATVPELLTAGLATLPVASEPQGEAAGYAADGSAYFTTSEGAAPPLYRIAD